MNFFVRIALLLAAFSFSLAATAADPLDAGPTTLTLQYHTLPGDRVALKDYMRTSGLKQLASWQAQGLIKDYRVYWSRYVDSLNWDMLVLLQFASTKEVSEWRKVEERLPGGLPVGVAKLCTAIHTNPADLYFTAGEHSPNAVFLVIPYDYTVSTPEYLKYANSYMKPQYEGWIGEKVLSSYELYIGRFGAARHWSALLVLEYKDESALGVREQTLNKVRSKLRDNAEWKAIHENKQNVRVTRQYVMADLLK